MYAIPILILIFPFCSTAGYLIASHQPQAGKKLLLASTALGLICTSLTCVAILFPAANQPNESQTIGFIREYVLSPAIYLWFIFLTTLITCTSYLIQSSIKKQGVTGFLITTVISAICTCLYSIGIYFVFFLHAVSLARRWN